MIADDHPLFREGVVSVLKDQFDVQGQASNALEAVRLARELSPDLILLDINMPGNGIQAVQAISSACPDTKIVMLTISPDDDHVIAALKAGARGYVSKGISARELVSILQAIHEGESYVTPSLAAHLLLELSNTTYSTSSTSSTSSTHRSSSPSLGELNERERQVLEGVAEGLSNKEIALRCHLTEKTVKHYVSSILQKLHVHNRVEAALLARNAK